MTNSLNTSSPPVTDIDSYSNHIQIYEVGDLCINSRNRSVVWRGKSLNLTATEFNLLFVLTQHSGKTVSKSQLSLEALHKPLQKFDRSIDVHIHRLRLKMGPNADGMAVIQTIHKQGFQFLIA